MIINMHINKCNIIKFCVGNNTKYIFILLFIHSYNNKYIYICERIHVYIISYYCIYIIYKFAINFFHLYRFSFYICKHIIFSAHIIKYIQ